MGARGRRLVAGLAGAQAAIADLARASQAEAAVDVDPNFVAGAAAAFTAFEAFYKARRTYSPDHPAVERFLGLVDDKLRAVLETYGELELALTARGMELGGEPVTAGDRPETNIWFPFHRDGVRELTIEPGVSREELTQLAATLVKLHATAPGAADDDGEDDAVTMLWDLALLHVDYVAIDAVNDAESTDPVTQARVAAIREMVTLNQMKELAAPPGSASSHDLEAARRLKSVALARSDVRVFERENLATLAELPRELREAHRTLYSITDAERAGLARTLAKDPAVLEKVLHATIHAVLAEEGAASADVICGHVEKAFTALLAEAGFGGAARMRRKAIAASAYAASAAMIARLDAAMASPAALRALVGGIATLPDETLDAAMELLEVMPTSCAGTLVGSLGQIEQRARRRRACQSIARWGQAAIDAVTAALPTSTEEVALDLLFLLRSVGSDASLRALELACMHTAPAIRANALREYAQAAPSAAVRSRTFAGLADADPIVRGAALDLLVAHQFEGAVRWLEEQIAPEAMADLDLGEKKRLFTAYAVLGGTPAAEALHVRLEQRNLLARSAIDDERIAAASALGHVRYAPARAALEKVAKTTLVRNTVKLACLSALEDLERPPPGSTRPPPLTSDAPRAASTTDSIPVRPTTTEDPLGIVRFTTSQRIPRTDAPPVAEPTAIRTASPTQSPVSVPRTPSRTTEPAPRPASPPTNPAPHRTATPIPVVRGATPTMAPANVARTATSTVNPPTVPRTATPTASPTRTTMAPPRTVTPTASPTNVPRTTTPPAAPPRKDSRSAGGYRPMDDGVVVRRSTVAPPMGPPKPPGGAGPKGDDE